MKKLILTTSIPLLALVPASHAWYNQNLLSSGDWHTPGNWEHGVIPGTFQPNPPDNQAAGSTLSHGWIGQNRTVNVNANATMWIMHLGDSSTTTGTVNVNAGTLNITGEMRGGRSNGSGVMNVASGATVTTPTWTGGGWSSFTSGTTLLNVNGGTVSANTFRVATAGQGTVNVNAGGVINAGTMVTANNGSGTGTLNINGGTVNSSSVINNAGSSAIINHTSGTWNNSGTWFELAPRSGATATYNFSGGTINQNGSQFIVGANNGDATMIMTNGAILNSANNVTLGGSNAGSDGVLTITDTAAITTGNLTVSGGTSSMTQSGDSIVTTSTLNIGGGDSYDLQGGTLRVNGIANSGTFTWGDATLTTRQVQQNADNGSTDFSNAGFNEVKVGTTLDINSSLTATGAKSTLGLNSLYINNGVRFDQLTVTGTLSLTGTDDTLDATFNPYLLRPNVGTATDSGSLPLITATSISGVFESEPTFLQDNIGWSEFTGTFSTAAELPTNTYYLEYTGDTLFLHYNVEGTVPEPGTVGLLALGLLFVRGTRQRLRMSKDA